MIHKIKTSVEMLNAKNEIHVTNTFYYSTVQKRVIMLHFNFNTLHVPKIQQNHTYKYM